MLARFQIFHSILFVALLGLFAACGGNEAGDARNERPSADASPTPAPGEPIANEGRFRCAVKCPPGEACVALAPFDLVITEGGLKILMQEEGGQSLEYLRAESSSDPRFYEYNRQNDDVIEDVLLEKALVDERGRQTGMAQAFGTDFVCNAIQD